MAGENIGWNDYPDDVATAQIQSMFMGSSGHRANILGKAWDRIGIGAYKGADGKKMWTVLFADKCGVRRRSRASRSRGRRAEAQRRRAEADQADADAQAEADARPDRPTPTGDPARPAGPCRARTTHVRTPIRPGPSSGRAGRRPPPVGAAGPASVSSTDQPPGGLLESIVGGIAGRVLGSR